MPYARHRATLRDGQVVAAGDAQRCLPARSSPCHSRPMRRCAQASLDCEQAQSYRRTHIRGFVFDPETGALREVEADPA